MAWKTSSLFFAESFFSRAWARSTCSWVSFGGSFFGSASGEPGSWATRIARTSAPAMPIGSSCPTYRRTRLPPLTAEGARGLQGEVAVLAGRVAVPLRAEHGEGVAEALPRLPRHHDVVD